MSLELNLSVFNSIDFTPDWRHHFERNECYVQKFLTTDVLTVIYSLNKDYVLPRCEVQVVKDGVLFPVSTDRQNNVAYSTIKNLPKGLYEVKIVLHGKKNVDMVTSYIEVFDELEDSFLLAYSDHITSNELLADYVIQTRMEGGFLNREKQFKADDEKFRDQTFSIHNLNTYCYESHTLTFGTTKGVPYWVGRKANAIFSLPSVLIDGVRYVRSEGAEMEMITIGTQNPLYVFKLEVEPDRSSLNLIDTHYRYRIFEFPPFDDTYN